MWQCYVAFGAASDAELRGFLHAHGAQAPPVMAVVVQLEVVAVSLFAHVPQDVSGFPLSLSDVCAVLRRVERAGPLHSVQRRWQQSSTATGTVCSNVQVVIFCGSLF